jgi:hypothetical protein
MLTAKLVVRYHYSRSTVTGTNRGETPLLQYDRVRSCRSAAPGAIIRGETPPLQCDRVRSCRNAVPGAIIRGETPLLQYDRVRSCRSAVPGAIIRGETPPLQLRIFAMILINTVWNIMRQQYVTAS